MLLVYTGDGKGKTSASVGQTIRAMGQDMRVAFCQFMKRPGQAGEQALLKKLLGDRCHIGGLGFLRPGQDREPHREAAQKTLAWAENQLYEGAELLVLDESLYALSAGLITAEELKECINAGMAKGAHIVVTGRGVPEWLAKSADLITEMTPIKHHFEKGVTAQRGIEF